MRPVYSLPLRRAIRAWKHCKSSLRVREHDHYDALPRI